MANEQRMRPKKRKKVCAFCVDKVTAIDYKDTAIYHLKETNQITLVKLAGSDFDTFDGQYTKIS